jgi:hypothetical protein
MVSDLKVYFIDTVLHNYCKYVKLRKSRKIGRRNDLTAAINISTILYHLREYLPEDKAKSDEEMGFICPDFEWLRDVVNLSKHSKITRYTPKISDVNNIYEQVISTCYEDKKGKYWNIEKSVFVKQDDGTERDLFEIITNVMNMWLIEFEHIGIIEQIKPFSAYSTKIPSRSNSSIRLDQYVTAGLPFKQSHKLHKYNYEKGIIEACDLTNSRFDMNIYKPMYTVAVSIGKNQGGEEIHFEIQVDKDQLKELTRIKLEEKKIQFVLKMAYEQGVKPILRRKD